MNKKPLIILTGPTAVGKTKASIALAKAVNGEIISADSMQVYKYMDIGTAKITTEEMDGVTHYLIDDLLPNQEFSVAVFKEMALKAMNEIYEKGKIPIIVGGTGFYIQALLYDIDFSEVEGHPYREELECFAQEHGANALHHRLLEIDPQAAKDIHENNVKRVIRAIEYYYENGRKISEHNALEREKESPYTFCYIVLNDKREHLYSRIDSRIDIMKDQGLVEEVEGLLQAGYSRDLVAMQGLGYKEIVAYLEGEISLEEALRILKRDTRHFAKRQITWFKRERDVQWIQKDAYEYDEEKIKDAIIALLIERDIISC
ncbi:MAG: tRNA (adenosine(37)-N6)-dimethylallyltransferase MiaA [Eubacteriales bacterium]